MSGADNCSQWLAKQGQASPRTCRRCGLGPCPLYPKAQTTQPSPDKKKITAGTTGKADTGTDAVSYAYVTPSPDDVRNAALFLLWQFDRGGPVNDSLEAWEALRAALASQPAASVAVGEDAIGRQISKALAQKVLLSFRRRDGLTRYAHADNEAKHISYMQAALNEHLSALQPPPAPAIVGELVEALAAQIRSFEMLAPRAGFTSADIRDCSSQARASLTRARAAFPEGEGG